MKNIILIMIFVLLLIGAFFIVGINPFRRKSYISLAKQVQEEKFRNVDERFDRLALKDRIITTIQNTVSMGGSNMKIFSAMKRWNRLFPRMKNRWKQLFRSIARMLRGSWTPQVIF